MTPTDDEARYLVADLAARGGDVLGMSAAPRDHPRREHPAPGTVR